jgi:hypothetical protein
VSGVSCILHRDDDPEATMRDPTIVERAAYANRILPLGRSISLGKMYYTRTIAFVANRDAAESWLKSNCPSPRVIPKWVVAEVGSATS